MHSLDEIRVLIASVPWVQSKGYARKTDGAAVAPHQYIVKQKHPEVWDALRVHIKEAPDNYRGSYGGYTYTYWNCDGFKYWYAGYGIILNRVPIEDAAADPMAAPDPNAIDLSTGQRGI